MDTVFFDPFPPGIMKNNRIDLNSKSMMRGVSYILILTMVFNICIDLKIYLVSYFNRKEIAVLDNMKLARDENQPNSEDFKRGHLTDQYVSKSGRRYDFSIREATNETLCAVSLQVITYHKSLASYGGFSLVITFRYNHICLS